jgi:hypothetical protein
VDRRVCLRLGGLRGLHPNDSFRME